VSYSTTNHLRKKRVTNESDEKNRLPITQQQKKSRLSGPFWLRGKLEMNPIAPREITILNDDVDNIHNPGDEAEENIKDNGNDMTIASIFDDTVD
jgi:hypothetical protein